MGITRKEKKSQTLLYQGEVPSSVLQVSSGLVRALNISAEGEERTIALFGPGEFFPFETAFEKAPVALFYYETMVDTEVNFLTKEEFQKDMAEGNGTEELEKIANQYVASLLHINALSQTNARYKVACILQYLSLRFGEELSGGVFNKIVIQLTQQDIARLCGLTRETTTIELNKFKKEGYISVKKKYYSVHNKMMSAMLDNPEIKDVSI